MGRDHAGMADAHAAAARQLRDDAGCLPRTLRIQRAGFPARLHAANPGRSHQITKAFMEIPYTVREREDTGLYNAKLGIWLFLASEVMLFGALFSSYILLRVGAAPGYWPLGWLNVPLGTANTIVLICSSITVVMAWASLKLKNFGKFKFFQAITLICACA